ISQGLDRLVGALPPHNTTFKWAAFTRSDVHLPQFLPNQPPALFPRDQGSRLRSVGHASLLPRPVDELDDGPALQGLNATYLNLLPILRKWLAKQDFCSLPDPWFTPSSRISDLWA